MLDLEEQLSKLARHRGACVPPYEASTMRTRRRRRSALVAAALIGAIVAGSLGVLALASGAERGDTDRVDSAVAGPRPIVLDGPTQDVTARLTPHPNGDLEIEYRRGDESLLLILERHECAGRGAIVASRTETETGIVLRGVLPQGATGVTGMTVDGRSVTGDVWSSPRVRYPYFEMHTGSEPNWPTVRALGVDEPPPCITRPTTGPGTSSESTVVPTSEGDCGPPPTAEECIVTPDVAEALLGFPVRQPRSVPAGWSLVRSVVRDYAIGGGGTSRLYNQAWAPSADGAMTGGPYIQLRQRAELLGDLSADHPTQIELRDGSILYGALSEDGGLVQWVSDAVWYSITTNGVGEDVVVDFANSLR